MRMIEITGKTVDEAIANAALELSLPIEQIRIDILDNGTAATAENEAVPARIRAIEKLSPQVAEKARLYVEELLKKMGLPANVTHKITREDKMRLEIWNASDGGALIGYRGNTLNAIQYLVNQFVNRGWQPGQERVDIEVDTQNYRQRRQRMLSNMVNDAVNKVQTIGRPVELEPMCDVDRKFVHLMVRDIANVTSESMEEGEKRRVVISKTESTPAFINE
jgi:spoIIIJ-associated protein